MLEAQLRGKLSKEQENMEDILTSNVFGSFKYVHASDGLLPFLSQAKKPDGTELRDLLKNVDSAHYRFWPSMRESECHGCEPDVLIELIHDDGTKSLIMIESKYHSGKSSEADEEDTSQEKTPTDQLSKEWHNLFVRANEIEASPFLVYITADYACPRQDIELSQKELRASGLEIGEIYWLSWRSLNTALKGTEHEILRDLMGLMSDRYGLTSFEQMTINSRQRCPWLFEYDQISTSRKKVETRKRLSSKQRTIRDFNWAFNFKKSFQWRFKNGK